MTTTKIGIMYAAQMFAKRVSLDPMVSATCPSCGIRRPHTYWPPGRYMCMHCIHLGRSVLVRRCPVCGPWYHLASEDAPPSCYLCWVGSARTMLESVESGRVILLGRRKAASGEGA